MLKKNLLFIFLFVGINLSFVNKSFASWFAEPYVGYEVGAAKSGEQSILDLSVKNNSINGMFFGARAGYSFLNFSGGLEYSISKSQWKKESVSPKDSFIFAGVGIPGVRLMGAIGISHKFTVKAEEFSGKSYKLGLAFTGTPFININVEYLWRKFSKNGSAKIESSENFHKIVRASVSLPLP
ncbi:MAG: hypothetical protein HAW60_03765 [Bdellovibrionales bacterium]|nr:hypothetical protein [Bdellovibrionales bacterium]